MHPSGLPEHLAALRRTLVMSVLNVTPDSFSDGGRFSDVEVAVAHARAQVAAGADVIDVGGESTRPGATRIPIGEELSRVMPVVERLVDLGVVVSIDTMRAEVAHAAVAAGAALVNDVSGGLADPAMHRWLAGVEVPYVAMHWRGHSTHMDALASYDDVVADVCAELRQRLDALDAAGVDLARVVLDPGLGFAKTSSHNWALLAGMSQVRALGHPVLIGASRKRFLGELLGQSGQPRPVDQRDGATDAVTALAAAAGAWAVRVHEVRGSRDAIAVAAEWRAAGWSPVGGGPMTPDRTGPAAGPDADLIAGPADEATRPEPDGFAGPVGAVAGPDAAGRDLDLITLTGIRATGFHGVFDHERRDGQEFRVDAVLEVSSMARAARTDDLADTTDYGALALGIVAIIEGPAVNLIETLASRIAEHCLGLSDALAVSITVHKPQAPIPVPFDDVAVTVRRAR